MRPSTTEPSPPSRRALAWSLLRHGLQVAAFNAVVAVALAYLSDRGLALQMVYAQAIGLSIWAFIDFGRFALVRDPLSGWPQGRSGVLLVLSGIVFGYVLGTTIGDAVCNCSTWELWSTAPRRFLTYVALTVAGGALVSLYFHNRGREEVFRARLAAAQRDATQAKLTLLQSQLEPHMLFNTLANLRALIALDPPRAQAMLDRLIAFLRATLSASRIDACSLATEFARLDDYLALMAVRMGPRLRTTLELPEALRDQPVPPLLLQPLVENAIRHGLEPQVGGGQIVIRAARDGEMLVLSVHDTGAGLRAAAPPDSGFGLQQVRERLATLYGTRAHLALEPAPGGGTLARITLPWSPNP